MDRLTKLRCLSSSSQTSFGNGYETANDDSATSGSFYFSAIESDNDHAEASKDEGDTLSRPVTSDYTTDDQTLENDFSLEEVSTIRKPMIIEASPATVKIASQMNGKYMGVASTPARITRRSLKTPGKTPRSVKCTNLSGIDKLDTSNEKSSIMLKMREPKFLDSSTVDNDVSHSNLDTTALSAADSPGIAANKSSETDNALANFFASLNTKNFIPVPQIIITAPQEVTTKATATTEKENCPSPVQRRRSARKSLSYKMENGPKTRSSILTNVNSGNRVASPITKVTRKSSLVKILPERLKEMRKANQLTEMIKFRRSVSSTRSVLSSAEPAPGLSAKEDIVGDCIKVNDKSYKPITAIPKPAEKDLLKRKSVVPAAVVRKSMIPAKMVRQSINPNTNFANQKVPVKVPARTTLVSSSNALRKRSIAPNIDKIEPLPKRKSVVPTNIKSMTENDGKLSRTRPATTAATVPFKKPETFSCDTCQHTFRLKTSLESHRKLAHQNPTNSPKQEGSNKKSDDSLATKCRHCAKEFVSSRILSNHILTNCLKIPPLEKRKLLIQEENHRAATAKPTGETTRPNRSHLIRPSTVAAVRQNLLAVVRDKVPNTSVDGESSDTSTTSSIKNSTANNIASKRRTATGAVRKRTTCATGISRTPKKEVKCHFCNRRFLNTVEYALHVEAHTKAVEPLKKDEEPAEPKDDLYLQDAAEIMQKLATLKNRIQKR